jgi:two-component system sensor histidine kinase BaeS
MGMRISVAHKLFLTFLIASGVVVVSTVVFMTWSFERGFVRLVEARQQERVDAFVERLSGIYAREGGWHELAADRRRWGELLSEGSDRPRSPPPPPPGQAGAGLARPPPPPPGHPPPPGERPMMLLDAERTLIFGRQEDVPRLTLHPIDHDGRTVGYLGVLPGPALEDIGDVRFVERQTQAFALIAFGMVVLYAVLALPMARRMVRPLRAFTQASQALAAGRYETRIDVESRDELGQLARDFNVLAMALERNEWLRRQWVADVSHELRTPLAILRGELEALQDGVRTLGREPIDSLHGDVVRLTRLVDDLYELSMSDLGALRYRKTETDAVEILKDDLDSMAEAFRSKGIKAELKEAPMESAVVMADPDRLSQLFLNLLKNSLRYTDPGGRLEVAIARNATTLTLDFRDSAPGVSEADLPHLFERFYRVESSRSRALGGAGLGLAICRNIAEAHGGGIEARSSELGGLWVRLKLPL